jgi:hypothetical protein
MSLKSLICLVLAVLLGTLVTVRWYLRAEQGAPPTYGLAVPAVVPAHLPLPMRAEPARSGGGSASPSRRYAGLALGPVEASTDFDGCPAAAEVKGSQAGADTAFAPGV